MSLTAGNGAVAWLRLEGLAAFAFSVVGYRMLGGGWGLFALLLLVPDLTMLGYLVNPRLGATVYNLGHTHFAPALLAAAGWVGDAPVVYGIALIWTAHIGIDRMLGYGLKLPTDFRDTHLGRIGKDRYASQ